MVNPFLGQISMVGFNFAPRGWALCDGQLLPISQNSALFSLLGTTYGGDGRTTFALPDLRGRAPIHPGTGPGLSSRRLGERAGSETNILTASNLPSHNHSVNLEIKEEGDTDDPDQHYIAGNGVNSFGTAKDSGKTLAVSNTGNAGSSTSVNNMQPYLVINYVIALQGTYPSRS